MGIRAIGLQKSLDLIGAIRRLMQASELLIEGLATGWTVAGLENTTAETLTLGVEPWEPHAREADCSIACLVDAEKVCDTYALGF